MESSAKRAKKSDWKQYFTVLQKGELYMFVFGSGMSGFSGGEVGGGNWLVRLPGATSLTRVGVREEWQRGGFIDE